MKDLEVERHLRPLMRNMHRWSAHGMVISVFLHLCRVFYTGSYKPPREFNWVIGVLLLVTLPALIYRLPAAVGPTGDSGRSPSARISVARPRSLARGQLPPASAIIEIGQPTLDSVLHPACDLPAADRRVPDGGPLLAHPQGRRYLWPAVGSIVRTSRGS